MNKMVFAHSQLIIPSVTPFKPNINNTTSSSDHSNSMVVSQIENLPETIVSNIKDFFDKTESTQKLMDDKLDKLERGLKKRKRIRIVVMTGSGGGYDNETTNEIMIILSKFSSFYVELVNMTTATYVPLFLEVISRDSIDAVVMTGTSKQLALLNEYLNNHPHVNLHRKIIISLTSTAPDLVLNVNGTLKISKRNPNILRLSVNDNLQVASFVTYIDHVLDDNVRFYLLYENDGYGIPFYNALKLLQETSPKYDITFYTSDKIADMINDAILQTDKNIQVLSILYPESGDELLDSLYLHDENGSGSSLAHVTNIIQSETLDFYKLSENRYNTGIKYRLMAFSYIGANIDSVTRRDILSELKMESTLINILTYDCGSLIEKVFSSINRTESARLLFIKESKTMYGVSGLLRMDDTTFDRSARVNEIEFVQLLKGRRDLDDTRYVTALNIKNGLSIQAPVVTNDIVTFDFVTFLYSYITNHGTIYLTEDVVRKFNEVNNDIQFQNNEPTNVKSYIMDYLGLGSISIFENRYITPYIENLATPDKPIDFNIKFDAVYTLKNVDDRLTNSQAKVFNKPIPPPEARVATWTKIMRSMFGPFSDPSTWFKMPVNFGMAPNNILFVRADPDR